MDLIIGGGKYGEYAFQRLQTEDNPIILLDTDPACALQTHHHLPEITVEELRANGPPPTGAAFIRGGIAEAADVIVSCRPERIFPTVPVHLAAGVISSVAGCRPDPAGAAAMHAEIPDDLIIGRRDADVYCSLNHIGRCPDRCPAPPVCPVTGVRRAAPLHRRLRESLGAESAHQTESRAVVIESHQFGPGLGYLRTEDLLHTAAGLRGAGAAWVGTACRCHGVVTALIRDGSPVSQRGDSAGSKREEGSA